MKNKNIFFYFSLFLISTNAFSQTEKGKLIIGLNSQLNYLQGDYHFQNSSVGFIDKNDIFSQKSNVFLGVFLKKNFLLGFSFGSSFENRKVTPDESRNEKTDSREFTLQARQYFYYKNNLFMFTGAGFRFKSGKFNELYPYDKTIKSSDVTSFGEVGLNYLITKKIAFEATVTPSASVKDFNGIKCSFAVGLKYFPGNKSYFSEEELNIDHKNWLVAVRFGSSNSPKKYTYLEERILLTEYEVSVGRFLGPKRNHTIGLALGVSTTKTNRWGDQIRGKGLMITPAYEYFLKTKRLSPFIGIYGSFLIGNSGNNDLTSSQRLSLGLAYFLKDHFLIKANLITLSTSFYNRQDWDYHDWHYSSLDFNLFNSSSISLAYRW
ncbi:hypothetical protein GVN16_20645 [Emticicia sp. CRIBPO]|uniref:hypothetical protein n=1 Tax=Emticicia sp. CRIBPO TaxID=2683258 RepID=UPI0014124C3A|nr:hypothetical protein [Emticicia sp. CRIBPO]NBA88194.1 hypothetical protein [Emticicia sp. CRIBPO]